MIHKTDEALSRSDRVLVAALAIVLATASAATGAAMAAHPHKATASVVALAAPAKITVIGSSQSNQDVAMTQLLAEHRCLSEAIYYEARGEGPDGEEAVAEVVFHRMRQGDYGNSICAVVYEGASRPGCQFSFTCNGDLLRPKQPGEWQQAEAFAARILTGEVRLGNSTGGATHYHAVSVTPMWADTLERTTQIGNHIFYRNPPHTRPS